MNALTVRRIPKRALRLLALATPLALAGTAPLPARAQTPATAEASQSPAGAVSVRFDAPPPDAVERGVALRKLGTARSVLMIGAHPDDENTAVLAALALGLGTDVAYLSLTRGEGGQNGIGPEQQEALGLLRTEELLAARDVDRGRQFFTRAYDFGFSKHADEAFQHWPREALLEDVVRVVRSFRPDVMVAVFTGTPADGHGQHQASGIMAREAFEAAADPARFPAAGAPHAATSLFRARFRGTDDATLVLQTGLLDPLMGRSHHQVAMASRSEHRSQDMGQAQHLGGRQVALDLVATRVPGGAPTALFAGVEDELSARAETASGSVEALRDAVAPLRTYEGFVGAVRAGAGNPAALLTRLVSAGESLSQAARAVEAAARDEPAAEGFLHAVRREQAQYGLALAQTAGVRVDVRAEDATVVPGQTFSVAVSVWNGGSRPMSVDGAGVTVPEGWEVSLQPAEGQEAEGEDSGGPVSMPPGTVLERTFRVGVPVDAPPHFPYFLLSARDADRYVWGDHPSAGAAFQPDPVGGIAHLTIGRQSVAVRRAAAYVGVDKTVGEYRRPVLVLPGLAVTLAPAVALVGASASRPVEYTVRVDSREPETVRGVAALELPDGWSSEPAEAPLEIASDGAGTATFSVTAPASAGPGEYAVAASFGTADGRSITDGVQVIDYPHIRPRVLPTHARGVIQVLDAAVPEGLLVAYVEGAGDAGPDALQQLGIDYTLLGPEELASGDLSRFDTIVLGIRAYEFRPDVVANNGRLLDYARAGGTLIVQYNKYEFPRGEFAPYPLTMSRPHDRVTDESAEVTILDPAHSLFTWPNSIGRGDFEGWVQERGLYFAATWDERFTPLLEMADPGEAPLGGSTLIAPLGEGTYVYTALSLFRQLPAGVPGAYRLLANLVALGADRDAS
ncbi:MAG: PIG-L family deacetylase [Gemmatimonadota bacterium]